MQSALLVSVLAVMLLTSLQRYPISKHQLRFTVVGLPLVVMVKTLQPLIAPRKLKVLSMRFLVQEMP